MIINDIKYFLSEKEKLTEKLKIYVKDKNIPLEIRWELFVESELGKTDDWVLHLTSVDLDSFYGDSYLNRGQIVNADMILDWVVEEHPEKEDEVMEELLDQFIYSFIFDW